MITITRICCWILQDLIISSPHRIDIPASANRAHVEELGVPTLNVAQGGVSTSNSGPGGANVASAFIKDKVKQADSFGALLKKSY
jgi:hypothetical protein